MTGVPPIAEVAEQAGTDRIASIAERLRTRAGGGASRGLSFEALVAEATAKDPAVAPARTEGRIRAASVGGGSSLGAVLGRTGPGNAVVSAGLEHLGVPYKWGGTDPVHGFDCSGLVQDAYRQIGVEIPKWSRHQATMGVEVPSLDQALPGDILAFGEPVNHVALYMGDGQMLHAPRTGEVVKVEEINRPIATIRRVVAPNGSPLVGAPAAGAAARAETVPAPAEYRAMFEAAGSRWNIDPDLLAAVASVESGFDPGAVSPVGAQGLMQFMPATAAEMGVDPWDPASAIDGAARYLRTSIDQFDTLEEAIASYNAGRGAVRRHNGVPPFAETQRYVEKVLETLGGR